MDYGCIARKLGHSFSAEIHRLIGDYDYRLCEGDDEIRELYKFDENEGEIAV